MKKNVNQRKLGIILSYISRIIQVAVGLLYTPLMIRLLGQAEFGLYNIAASVVAYLGILNFGFGSAYMRFYSRYKVDEDKDSIKTLNGMFLIIFSVLGLFAIITGIILAMNTSIIFDQSLSLKEVELTKRLILILVLNLGVSFPFVVFNTYIQANEQFIFYNLIQIIRQITTPLISLPLLLAGYGSTGMVIGMVSVNIILEVMIAVYSLNKLKMSFSFKKFDKGLMREMTVYSSYIFINMIVDQINSNLDKTILGRYQGTVSVAIYSVAANLNAYYTQISTTISYVFIPRIHHLIAQEISDSELTSLFTRVGRIQFVLLSLVSSGFIIFGRSFIEMWAGENYYQSYYVVLFLMIPITIPLIQNIGIEIQRAKNMHQFRSIVYVIMAIGNLIITIPLSIEFGAVGAAFGTALSYLLGNGIAMNWHYHYKIGLDMRYFWREIIKFVPALLVPLFYGGIIYRFINLHSIKNLLLFGMIYVLIFSVSMWFIGLNDYEKKLVKSPFK